MILVVVHISVQSVPWSSQEKLSAHILAEDSYFFFRFIKHTDRLFLPYWSFTNTYRTVQRPDIKDVILYNDIFSASLFFRFQLFVIKTYWNLSDQFMSVVYQAVRSSSKDIQKRGLNRAGHWSCPPQRARICVMKYMYTVANAFLSQLHSLFTLCKCVDITSRTSSLLRSMFESSQYLQFNNLYLPMDVLAVYRK